MWNLKTNIKNPPKLTEKENRGKRWEEGEGGAKVQTYKLPGITEIKTSLFVLCPPPSWVACMLPGRASPSPLCPTTGASPAG